MKSLSLILLFLLFSILSFSQEKTQTYTLEEAIDYALKNNRNVKNAARDIEAAKKQKWETTATGLPQLNTTVEYQNWLKQQVSLIPAEFFPDGILGEFAEVAFGTKQNLNATATLSQLLFDGSYLVGLQSAKVFLEISKNAKEKTDLEVRKIVINAYGNILLTEESLSILEKNKKVLEKNLNDTKKIFENGLTEEESVEQLQITLASIDNNLKNAIRLNKIAYQMFNITLGNDVKTPVELTENLNSLTAKNLNIGLLSIDNNVNNNIDYKIAENDKRSKELLVKFYKTKGLPSLTAFVNGGYIGYADDFNFTNSDQRWIGSSLFGVSLNVPLFSSFGRSARTQRAKIDLEKAKTNLTEIEQQIQLETETAKSNYQFAVEQYLNVKNNLHLAESIEYKNQVKYIEGIATSFELRQAQTQLYTSQQEYLQSMLNVIITKAELEVILNKITQNDESAVNQSEPFVLDSTTDTKEIQVLKEQILLADKKSQQKSELERIERPISESQKTNNLTDEQISKTEIKQPKKLKSTGSVIKKANSKPAVRHIDGVKNGFYLIAGVFSNKKNLDGFITQLSNKGLNANYFHNQDRNLYYIYLSNATSLKEIESTKKTNFNGQYFEDTWILSIQNK